MSEHHHSGFRRVIRARRTVAASTCPCQTDVEEPGPHIATCLMRMLELQDTGDLFAGEVP